MSQNDAMNLGRLIGSKNPFLFLPTFEEAYAIDQVQSAAMDKHRDMLIWTVTIGLRDALVVDTAPLADTSHPAGALTHLATQPPANSIIVMLDLASHLKDERTLRCLREALTAIARVESILVMIDSSDELPPVVAALATRYDVSLPDAVELEEIVRRTLREWHQKQPIEAQLRREDLDAIIQNMQGLSRRQARQAIIETISEDQRIDVTDIPTIIAFKKRALRSVGVLEPVESPITLDEIGGLVNLKKWLALRSKAMTTEAAEFGLDMPKGVLMLGVQGSGKSLAAKAVATAWRRPLLRMDVGALFDRYIGESERKLRDALRQAEMMSPVILWIDEIEKAFASSASQNSDGGLSKRMFGSLLTWMQERIRPVFLIATANDIEALPPELLRKGRFDDVFFVDLPIAIAREQILTIHLKKRNRQPDQFNLKELAKLSEGYSGAEIEQAIISALFTAFDSQTLLTDRHIAEALKSSPPLSVTMAERIQSLRTWSKSRCVPAD